MPEEKQFQNGGKNTILKLKLMFLLIAKVTTF
jgi:hypothetical protein